MKVEQHEDHVVVEFEGLSIVITRSCLDGALLVDIDTTDLEPADVHPRTECPRLRLSINDWTQQIGEGGEWEDDAPYPPNVLDHLAGA